MKIDDFELECFFAKYEFSAPYLLAQSDCESMTTADLLALEPGAKEAYLNQWLGYTETWGDPELRQLIADLYQYMNNQNILVFHGAQEAIFAYMNVMLDAGDHMIVMYPNYQSAYEVANATLGCSYSKWHIHDSGNQWTIDFDELESLIQPNTKLIAVNSPNNPTGFTFSNEQIQQLCDICRKHELFLFSDEVYKGLEHDGSSRYFAADLYDKATSLGVMSKAYGLAGLRVGWMACKDTKILDKAVRFKHYMSICDSAPSEFLAKVALKHGDELLTRNRSIITSNIALTKAFFNRHKNLFQFKEIIAGPIAFHRIICSDNAMEFCTKLVEKSGVFLLPGTVYGISEPYFRMGYGRRGMEEGLAKLEDYLHKAGFVRPN